MAFFRYIMSYGVLKRLDSRHIHKEIKTFECMYGINTISCKTGPKHFQGLAHKCRLID